MYKRKDFPCKGDLVLGTVKEISNIMVKVELDEYEDAYGIIPIDEISHKRIKNVREVVDIGKKIVCLVMDSDPANRLATLSLKRVSEGQKKLKIYQYKREQTAYNLLLLLSEQENIPIETLHEEIVYKILSKGRLLYQVWEEAYMEGKAILEKYGIPKKYVNSLYRIIKEHFNVPKYVRKGYIEMYTLASDGIDRLKKVLLELKNIGLEVKYAGAPRYYFKLEHYNPKELDKTYRKMEEVVRSMAEHLEIEYEIVEE
ncbi:MAG TPA: S1 RNA-binding domain-containing protein [Candidatus Nanopusillus sp.]|nr:S1 RNA-binding domain-containing protein [Candidatus Nanopusillus sp.]